jgi:hypothetical protein
LFKIKKPKANCFELLAERLGYSILKILILNMNWNQDLLLPSPILCPDCNTIKYRINYKNLSVNKILRQIDRIDNLDNFYRFCQEKILNFRGRDLNKLAETLRELVYCYNHRNKDMFPILLNRITY